MGFRRGARLEDAVVQLMTALQHAHHTQQPLRVLFVDLRKAYDSVDRGDLWWTLAQGCQVPPGLL